MKVLRVDKQDFYNLLEDLFNQIYGKNYVKQKEQIKEDNTPEKNTIYVEKIKYLETKDKKQIAKTTQVSKIILNKGIKEKESNLYFNTSTLTENQLRSSIQESAFEYNFLAKLPIILKSINIKENKKDQILTIPEKIRQVLVEELVNYEQKDIQSLENLEINLYEKTKNKTKKVLEK